MRKIYYKITSTNGGKYENHDEVNNNFSASLENSDFVARIEYYKKESPFAPEDIDDVIVTDKFGKL